jgi:hypothetical protein
MKHCEICGQLTDDELCIDCHELYESINNDLWDDDSQMDAEI